MSTVNPTADEYIDLVPTDLGATAYVEIIVIDQTSGTTPIGTGTACDRVCNSYAGFSYYRDLCRVDSTRTVKSLLNATGRLTLNYTPYYRDYNTNTMKAAAYGDVLSNRKSIVYVRTTMSAAQLQFALAHLGTHREILPSRMPK